MHADGPTRKSRNSAARRHQLGGPKQLILEDLRRRTPILRHFQCRTFGLSVTSPFS